MPRDHITPPVRYELVAGWPAYRVGDDGSVWSRAKNGGRTPGVCTDVWRPKKTTRQSRDHLAVRLGRRHDTFVHRLVLEAFVGPCPEGMECRHLDGDPTNNRLDNLEWGTPKENGEDRVRHGTSRKGELNAGAILTVPCVRLIVAGDAAGIRPRDIAEALGVSPQVVAAVLVGAAWNHVTGLPPYAPKARSAQSV